VTAERKTYSHLADARKIPSDYDIGTSKLHYYVERGFEVSLPLEAWYREHQRGSPLRCIDWERFSDPRQTTYTKYVAVQRDRESHVDAIHQTMEARAYDATLTPEWINALERFWSPCRFLGHGLQMLAAYVGQMAPSGRITIACAFQAADEVRRIHRIAYRTAELMRSKPSFGSQARETWQGDAAWQPTRRLAEQMLVTYDWGEAFTALNLCAKPVLDQLLLVELAAVARRQGDPSFGDIAFSLYQDSAWHRSWAHALVETAIKERPENGDVLRGWIGVWLPRAEEAARALAQGFDAPPAAEAASASARAWLDTLGVLR
jgi:toluene monooxygenase system protein E